MPRSFRRPGEIRGTFVVAQLLDGWRSHLEIAPPDPALEAAEETPGNPDSSSFLCSQGIVSAVKASEAVGEQYRAHGRWQCRQADVGEVSQIEITDLADEQVPDPQVEPSPQGVHR